MSSRGPSLSLPEPPAELAALSEQLCTRIIDEIESAGPMPFDRYMAMALYEPGLGYYVNGLHKLGAAGDFVTAPEQGRLFAVALARQIDEIATGLGEGWTLLELGAGSGVLARDVLGALDHLPARYLILEPSAPLREVQAEMFASLPDDLRSRIEWIDQPPDARFDGVIVANEIIDALPVARFAINASGLAEYRVTVQGNRLDWTLAPARPRLEQAAGALQQALKTPLAEGYASEICLDLPGWLKTVTEPLARGLALFIDYGYPRAEYYHPDRNGGTLVCHYRHRAHFDPFVWPGLTDLSAFVDFTLAADAAVDCDLEVAGFTTQAGFLLGLGITDIVEAARSDRERLALAAEIKRLVLPGEMGEKFKVLGLARDFDRPLRGFEMMSQLHRL